MLRPRGVEISLALSWFPREHWPQLEELAALLLEQGELNAEQAAPREDVPFVVELRDGGPGVKVRR